MSRTLTDRELSIRYELKKCKHYTGTIHERCLAGVNYRQLVGGPDLGWGLRLPCGLMMPKGKTPEPPVTCDKRKYWTEAEAAHRVDEQAAVIERHMMAFRVAHDDAKAKGFRKNMGGASSVPCPVCQRGQIHYTVATYNGHMHAACETDKCVRWVE